MATTRLQLLLALLPAASVATLGPMCCGDNFCCALSPSKSISCWGGGGNPFTPPSGSFAALSCAGKAGIAVDDTGAIAACFGSAGYGSEGCATGTVVADAATSFWGGCKIAKATGALSCWGATTVYGTNSRSTLNECTSMYGASSCNAVSVLLAPPSTIPGGYRTVACGGKRAGHFCCAVAARDGTTTCFGKGSSAYAPSAMPLATPHMLSCGTDFCCTLTGTGCVQCFGNLNQGRGGGTDIPSALAGPFVQISCGTYALYVLDKGGTVAAYGKVFSRVMGPVLAGTSTIAVPSNTKFSALPTNGGFGHACALSDSRAAVCWGADYARQVTNAPSSLIAASSAYTFPPSLGTPANPAIGTGPVVATTVMATTTVSTQALGTLGGDITPPYLRVKDGLDEKEALGFCIDLKGWNPVRYDDLQAHSCKKAGRASGSGSDVIGADQRFKLTDKSEIEVLFESNDGTRRCLAARDGSSGSGVDAKVCDGSTVQRFCLVKGEIRAQDGSGRCLVVGSASRQANTYMARTLLLADCQATQAELRMWVYIAQDKRKPQEDAPCGTDGGTPTSASTPPITTSLLTATTTITAAPIVTTTTSFSPSKESISTSSVSTSTPTLTTTTITTSETAKTTTTTTTTVVVTTTTTTTTTTSLASTEEGIVTTVSPVDYSGMSAEEAVKAAKRHQSLAATASTRAKAVLSECRRDCAAKAEASHTHTHTCTYTHTPLHCHLNCGLVSLVMCECLLATATEPASSKCSGVVS